MSAKKKPRGRAAAKGVKLPDVSQRATVARKEQPVSEGIRRAAERSGITPGQIEAASSPESMAEWSAKRAAFANQALSAPR